MPTSTSTCHPSVDTKTPGSHHTKFPVRQIVAFTLWLLVCTKQTRYYVLINNFRGGDTYLSYFSFNSQQVSKDSHSPKCQTEIVTSTLKKTGTDVVKGDCGVFKPGTYFLHVLVCKWLVLTWSFGIGPVDCHSYILLVSDNITERVPTAMILLVTPLCCTRHIHQTPLEKTVILSM